MSTLAWWHCYAGIAGDMALGSLVDAGAELDLIERELAGLPVGGWRIDVEDVLRGGVAATRLRVTAPDDGAVRTHAHITALVTEARLPSRVRDRALATFERLAAVEGWLHRLPASNVHFHEVGGIDAIIDVVGTCVALEVLGVDQVACSPIAQGTGLITAAHGALPNPSPAVAALLSEVGAPSYGTAEHLELTTPTGAALATTLATRYGPLPPMVVERVGYGAGTHDLERLPNSLRVIVGTAEEAAVPLGGPSLRLLEANVDDVSGEVMAHVVAAALDAGALDAWLTPIIAKKGRPAHIVTVLCDARRSEELRELVAAETGTLGVRQREVQRWEAPRSVAEVVVDGHRVRVKVGPHRVKAEHEDVVAVAAALGLPVREVARRAEGGWHATDPI